LRKPFSHHPERFGGASPQAKGPRRLIDSPRLYWTRDCTPGTEWFRFQDPVPDGRIWTSKDNSVTLPGWLVRDFADLGAGQGGYNEDHEFYGYRMPI
jgi:hypothetical protein